MTEQVQIDFPEIVARAGREYRIKRYILVAVLAVVGLWCLRDGFFKWPREQAEFNRATPAQQANMTKPENDWAIGINQALAVLFLALAPTLLVFTFYNSRGEIRLAGNQLQAPGHPLVPLERITQLDKSKWDRKGIAYAEYELPDARRDQIRLDDFVYQHQPIRAIVDRIEGELNPQSKTESPTSSEINET